MNTKQLGGILLITGNAIGGGMLALPLAASQAGFINSTLFLIACWAIMLAGSLLILEVNLCLPKHSHLISMARLTLGYPGQIASWLCYLLLLYALLAAYIAGSSDFLQGLLEKTSLHFPNTITATAFVLTLGVVVYRGIRTVDNINRIFMGTKFLVYCLLVLLLLPLISIKQLGQGNIRHIPNSIPIMITSFGFAAIIPSLRSYFHSDVKQLRRVIILGSFIPLLCYVLWNAAIMGIIPIPMLISITQTDQATSQLTNILSYLLNKQSISTLAWLFTSICLITSFLGVGLSLNDFLMDGLRLARTKKNRLITHSLSFLPPLIIVSYHPALFLLALNYAGVWCIGLLALLPALMAWSTRYRQHIASPYQVIGGKSLLGLLIVISFLIIAHALITKIIK